MADPIVPAPTPPPSSLSAHPAVQITQMILQTITLLFMMYVSAQANRNGERIEKVTERADEAAVRTEAVKKTVDESSSGPASREVALWATMKYLDSIADQTGTIEDKVKAAEAKRVYEAYKGKH